MFKGCERTTIGLGFVTMGSSVSSRGEVSSSAEGENQLPTVKLMADGSQSDYSNSLSSWAKAQNGPLGQ